MRIPIRRTSTLPVFRQIERALAEAIRKGGLQAGQRLPSTRELAGDLGINRMTVEAAYAVLETGGLIERRQGSGTYVLQGTSGRHSERAVEGTRVEWPLWQTCLPEVGLPSSAPSVPPRHDFATGTGDARLIPSGAFRKVFQDLIRKEEAKALGYESAQGYAPLRATIAEVLSSQGLVARPEQVLITSGSQQAISLVAQALLRPGDTVLVEEACYDSALALFRMLRLHLVPLPMDGDGIRVEEIEPLLQKHRPGLLYCMPNYQNPTGCRLHAHRRQALVDLAARYNLPILEDDYVGDLRYDGHAEPCLKTLDRGGGVLYTSTFSKMLMPGLRIGFLFAEGPVLGRLTAWKRNLELSSPAVLQRALHAYISVGRYRRHLRQSRSVYRERRDAMISALQAHFPKGTHFEKPTGGLFVWVRLPAGRSSAQLLQKALEAGVSFAQGDRFFAAGRGGESWLRLNFAANEIPVIEEGIRILGGLARVKPNPILTEDREGRKVRQI